MKEVRLGLVCYGGVSLAVYMHGLTKEIFKLVRAAPVVSVHAAASNSAVWRATRALSVSTPIALNALSMALMRTLDAELAAIAGDPGVTVVVIGGGATGLSAGWWLAREGVDVVVLAADANPE